LNTGPPVPNITFRQDHWLCWLRIINPCGLALRTEGNIPFEVLVIPVSEDVHEQIFEISISGDLPETITEAVLKIIATDLSGVAYDTMEIKLLFRVFLDLPVRFYNLVNLNYITLMDEPKLNQVIAYANEILGRQTNVYIYPVGAQGSLVEPFEYTDGDLGDPITNYDYLPGLDGAEDIWQQMAATSEQTKPKVLFVWNQECGESLGAAFRPGGLGLSWEMIMIDTQAEGHYDASAAYIAKILVHELGHWLATTFLIFIGGHAHCTYGDEHFRHGECTIGDWKLPGNLMDAARDNLKISANQASVYMDYSPAVQP
jgi:hypothetical protein